MAAEIEFGRGVFRLYGDDSQYAATMRRIDQVATQAGSRVSGQLAKIGQAFNKLGQAATVGLGATTAVIAGVTKASLKFEDAFAGVRKTVDATEAEFATLAGNIRELASAQGSYVSALPDAHQQLARIMELAGQLGIRGVENLTKFTETIGMLGMTTNLSTEEGATSLAQFMNIMQTSQENIDRIGSTIVDLGNNFATTERDIVEFAQRIAGAGKVVGLSEAEVMALATAMASLGINAEAGGTAISRIMIEIEKAVSGGGAAVEDTAAAQDKAAASAAKYATKIEELNAAIALQRDKIQLSREELALKVQMWGENDNRVRKHQLTLQGMENALEKNLNKLAEYQGKAAATTGGALAVTESNLDKFAKIAGQSAEEFKKAWEEDAASALQTFVEGLGKVIESGGDVFGILEDLELSDIRVRDALLRMANGGDILADALTLANRAWGENTALAEEAAKRYATGLSKLRAFKNLIIETAIQAGLPFLDVLGGIVERLGDFVRKVAPPVISALEKIADWFQALPAPLRDVLAIIAALAGGMTALGGAAALLGPLAAPLFGLLSSLAGPLGLVAIAVAALGTAFATNFLGIREIVAGVAQAVVSLGQSIASAFSGDEWNLDAMRKALEGVFGAETAGKITEFVYQVGERLFLLADWLKVKVPAALQALRRIWGSVWPPLLGIAQTVWGGVRQVIAIVINEVVPKVIAGFGAVAGWVSENWPRIQGVITTVWSTILTVIQTVVNTVVPFIVAEFQRVVTWVDANWPAIQETVGGVFDTILSVAETLATFFSETLVPAIGTIATFIGDNLVPILAGFAAFVLTVGVPVFVAWAAATWANVAAHIALAASIAAVYLPIIAGALAVAAVVGLLVAAWMNDWGGIRTTLTAFWENTARPIFETVKAWLETNIPIALQFISDTWNTVWGAVSTALAGFWTGTILPTFAAVKEWLDVAIPAALNFLSDVWQSVLLPAIEAVWTFITEKIIPLFQALANVEIALLNLALTALQGLWENVLLPALTSVWNFITTSLVPALADLAAVTIEALKTAVDTLAKLWEETLKPAIQTVIDAFGTVEETVEDALGPALSWFKDNILTPVANAFNSIGSAIDTVIGWLNDLTGILNGITLPAWLTPGSPTPFEYGLWGIGDAAEHVAGTSMPMLGQALAQVESPLDAVYRLIERLVGQGPDAIKTLGETLSAIAGGVTAFMDALARLSEYAGGVTTARIHALMEDVRTVVDELIYWAVWWATPGNFQSAGLASAKAIVEALEPVVTFLGPAVDALTALAAYAPAADMAERIAQLMGDLRQAIDEIIGLAVYFRAGDLAAAALFGGFVGRIIGFIGEAVDSLNKVKDLAPQLATFGRDVARLMDMVGTALLEMLRVSRWRGADAWEAAAEWAAAIMPAIGAVKAAVEAVSAVADLAPQGGAFAARARRLADMLGVLVLEFLRVRRWRESMDAWKAAGEWATVVAPALGMVKGAVDALASVAGLDAQHGQFGARARRLADMIGVLVLEFGRVRAWRGGAAWKAIGQWATDVAPAIAAIKTAADALAAIAELALPDAGKIGRFVEALKDIFTRIYNFLSGDKSVHRQGRQGRKLDVAVFATIKAFGETVGSLMGGLQAALGLLKGLADYAAPALGTVDRFMADVWRVFTRFYQWVSGDASTDGKRVVRRGKPKSLTDVALKLVEGFGGAVGALMAGLEAALALLKGLAEYVSPAANRLDQFEADVKRVFGNFAAWCASSEFEDELLDAVKGFGEALGDLMGGLESALSLLAGLAGYISPAEASLAAFEADVKRLFLDFYTWVADPANGMTGDALGLVQTFGDALGSLMGGLKTALELLEGLRYYIAPTQLSVDTFVANVKAIFESFKTWIVQDLTPAEVDAVGKFTAVFNELLDGLGAALGFMGDLNDGTLPGVDEFKRQLSIFNQNIVALLDSLDTWITEDLDPRQIEVVGRFTATMGNLVGGLSKALEFFVALESARLPSLGKLREYLDLLLALFQGLADGLAKIPGLIDTATNEVLARINAAYTVLPSAASWYDKGRSYGEQLAAGIRSATGAVQGALEKVKGLFPASPAKWGPFRELPTAEWVGAWLDDVGAQMQAGLVSLGALPDFAPAPAELAVNNVTIAISGDWQVRNDADVERIAREIMREARRQGVRV